MEQVFKGRGLWPWILAASLALSACSGGGSPSGGSSSGSSSGGVSSSSSSSGSSSSGSSSSSGAASYNWTALGSALDAYLTSASPAPSGSVAGYSFLLYRDTTVLYSRAGGVTTSGATQTVNSVVALASASKLPSAAAIMTLVDSGKLKLDQPVSTYLAGSGVTWPSDKSAITMRMLLAHTSGLPGLGDSSNPSCINQETSTTLQACAQAIANTALVSAPGSEFDYGGADYQVAGYIATVLAGVDWQTFFGNAIATPLGLSTFTYGPDSIVTNPRIAGGALSDVTDYAKILQMMQNGGVYNGTPVLSAGSVSVLEANQIAGVPKAYTPFPASVAAEYPGYGLGLWIESSTLYSPSTGPEYSDPGLYGTCPWIDNGLNYGAIILIDQDVPTGLSMWNAARKQIITQLNGG